MKGDTPLATAADSRTRANLIRDRHDGRRTKICGTATKRSAAPLRAAAEAQGA